VHRNTLKFMEKQGNLCMYIGLHIGIPSESCPSVP
jgi:hypothetical protein